MVTGCLNRFMKVVAEEVEVRVLTSEQHKKFFNKNKGTTTFFQDSEHLRWNLVSVPRDIYTNLTQELPSLTSIHELLAIR